MRYFARCLRVIAAAFVGIALASMPVAAQQTKAVGGFIVSLGVVPAAVALRAEGHRESHPANPPFGSQHLLITLDEEKSGKRIGDAEVLIEVTDPNGHKEKKPLLLKSNIRLVDVADSPPGGQEIETRFTIKHAI